MNVLTVKSCTTNLFPSGRIIYLTIKDEISMSKSDLAVKASSLRKEYTIDGLRIEALRSLELEIKEGEFVSIYGSSGAGKTTLLNIIGGLDKPTDGQIIVLGHDLSEYDEDFLATFRCAYVGYVFQLYNLISTLTVLENVMFPMQLAGWQEKRIMERCTELLELVGLTHRSDHFPAQLSGGELQRTAFARALANNPPLILADEPTANLDLETGLKIIRILEGLKGEKTVIVATHDERIMDLSERVLNLEDGRIVSNGF